MTRLLLLLALAAPADDVDPEPPMQGITGSWEVTRIVGKGPGPAPAGLVLKFTKDKMSVLMPNGPAEKTHTFTLNARKKPAEIDLVDGTNNNKKVAGIYKVEKGELFLTIGERSGKRPTTFDGSDEMVLVLRPQKKAK